MILPLYTPFVHVISNEFGSIDLMEWTQFYIEEIVLKFSQEIFPNQYILMKYLKNNI